MSNVELKGFKGLRELNNLMTDPSPIKTADEKIEKLRLEDLVPGKYQPRKRLDDEALEELADSIQEQGIIQPLIVRKTDQGKYEIIAGERRWRAAKIAGLTDVPVIIRKIEDNVALAVSLIENIQRENLNPVEEAIAFARFRDEFLMRHDQIAKMVGRSRTAITNALRLLSLEPQVRALLEEGRLEMGHARALLMLDPEQQLKVALIIESQQLNVREAEKLANAAKQPQQTTNKKEPTLYRNQCESWSRDFSQKFSAKVSVKLNEKGVGKVTIQVDSPEQVEWLIQHVKIN